jgi:O-antigen ligase
MRALSDNNVGSASGRPDDWRGRVLCLTVVLCPTLYSFHFTSFLHAKEIVFALSVIVMALLAALSRRITLRGFGAFLPLWIFIGVALAGAFAVQAKVPSDVLTKAAYWELLLLGVAAVFDLMSDDKWQTRVTNAISISAALVAALGLIQYAGFRAGELLFPMFPAYTQPVYSVFGNQDLYGGYLALGVPLLINRVSGIGYRVSGPLTRIGNWAALLGFAAVVPGIMISGSRSAWLAACVGTAVSVFGSWNSGLPQDPKPETRYPIPALVVLLMAVTAWLVPGATVNRVLATFGAEDRGVHARLWMWEGTLSMIRDAPILGVGLNNYAYWSPRYLGEPVLGPRRNAQVENEFYADQPHSEPLRVLAETGLIGAVCWLWMVARVIRVSGFGFRVSGVTKRSLAARDPTPETRNPVLGALLAFVVFALFNGPFDSVAHVFVGLLLASMLLRRTEKQRPSLESSEAAAGFVQDRGRCVHRLSVPVAVPILAVVLGGFLLLTVHVPSYLLRAAEDAHLGPQADVSLYPCVVDYPWPNARAHKEYGIALAEAGQDEEARQELLKALKGLDTGDIYLALALLASEAGDRRATRRWATECLFRWPGNPDALRLIEMQSPRGRTNLRNEASTGREP